MSLDVFFFAFVILSIAMVRVSEGSRAYVVTDESKGGILVIASTILFSWMVLCFFIRAYTRAAINGPFGLDDLVAGIGTVRTELSTLFYPFNYIHER